MEVRKSQHQIRIEEFNRKGGHEVPNSPTIPSHETLYRRANLIYEEFKEVLEAIGFVLVRDAGIEPVSELQTPEIDIAHVAKELADLSVVTIGTMSSFGIPDETVLRIVDQSNLYKVKDGVKVNEWGKIMKPPGWVKPEKLLREELGL